MRAAWGVVWLGALAASCASAPSPEERVLVVASLQLPAADDDFAIGLDLDGVTSSGVGETCVERSRDRIDPLDPSRRGIDNVLGILAPTMRSLAGCEADDAACLDALLTGSRLEDPAQWVIEVQGIDHRRDDDEVLVVFHEAEPAAPLETEGVRIAPGQRFTAAPRAGALGRIRDGWVEVDLTIDLAVSIATADFTVSIPLEHAHLRFELEGVRGALAGTVRVPEEPCGIDGCPDPGAALDAIAELADLDPRAVDPTRCEGISAAFSFVSALAILE